MFQCNVPVLWLTKLKSRKVTTCPVACTSSTRAVMRTGLCFPARCPCTFGITWGLPMRAVVAAGESYLLWESAHYNTGPSCESLVLLPIVAFWFQGLNLTPETLREEAPFCLAHFIFPHTQKKIFLPSVGRPLYFLSCRHAPFSFSPSKKLGY